MALITRVSRLFQADVHAVLDRIEEPDVLLRQAVREMEDELTHDERRLKLLSHEHHQLTARKTEVDQSLNEIDQELDVCFASSEENLARAVIKRQLEAQRVRKFLVAKCEAVANTLAELSRRLDENRARLHNMRQKAEILARDDDGYPPDRAWTMPDIMVRDEDVEVAFLREKQARSES